MRCSLRFTALARDRRCCVLTTLQGLFDARLKRKTDAVTGRVSKFAAENNRLWMKDFERQMADSLGANAFSVAFAAALSSCNTTSS